MLWRLIIIKSFFVCVSLMQTGNPKGHPDFSPVVKSWLLLDRDKSIASGGLPNPLAVCSLHRAVPGLFFHMQH